MQKNEIIVSVLDKMKNHPDLTEHEKSLASKLLELLTGKILDFNDRTVLDTHIPSSPFSTQNGIARGYATRYKEVLVERFIPAECCITIYHR